MDKAIAISEKDITRYKPILLASYKYYVMYYSDIDKKMAFEYTGKILDLDPDDKDGLRFKKKFK